MKKSTLVIFGEDFHHKAEGWFRQYEIVIAYEKLRKRVEAVGLPFVPIEPLVGAGNIHEASAFAEELSQLTFADGFCITKSFLYKGYELWWIHYGSLFYY